MSTVDSQIILQKIYRGKQMWWNTNSCSIQVWGKRVRCPRIPLWAFHMFDIFLKKKKPGIGAWPTVGAKPIVDGPVLWGRVLAQCWRWGNEDVPLGKRVFSPWWPSSLGTCEPHHSHSTFLMRDAGDPECILHPGFCNSIQATALPGMATSLLGSTQASSLLGTEGFITFLVMLSTLDVSGKVKTEIIIK